jgi:polyisoprenoid-binding protein YceI
MMRVVSGLACVALLCTATLAAETRYPLTGENTKITFTGTKKNGKHDGGFAKLSGTATITDGNPASLKVEVEIDCDSLYSDNDKLTGHLKNPDFFSVKDHPKATFKTTKVEPTDKGVQITGDLTMIGKTQPVTFPATVTEKDGVLTLTADFKIDRTRWGMTYGKGMIDNDVAIKVALTAKK